MIASTSMVGGDDCAHAEFVTIGDLSREFSVSPSTLRRMVDNKLLPSFITQGGHRRIPARQAREWFQARVRQEETLPSSEGPSSVIIYCRVSDAKRSKGFAKGEESDLTRQIERCKAYALEHYGEASPTVYAETGSGLNDERPNLVRMVTAILAHKHDGAKLICTFRDRIVRFGLNLIRLIAEAHNIELICIEATPTEEMEQELTTDIISIVTVYSGRIYGARAAKRLSVRVGEKELRDIFAWSKGYTPREIVARLKAEGRATGECGRPITKAVVARLIKKNRRVINDVVPTEQVSFAKWFAKHCRKVEGARTQRKLIMAAYKAWLAEHPSEVPLNDTNVGLWFKRQGIAKRFGSGGEILYVDVELR